MTAAEGQQICCRCGQLKTVGEFSFKDQPRGILHSYCRVCHKAWNRGHYERNRDRYIATAKRNTALYQAEKLRQLLNYLRDHPCIDCGETDPVVLDFDHRDPSLKRMEVGNLVRYAAWATVESEISMCDVRCANCHRRRTAAQFRWRKLITSDPDRAGAAGLEPAAWRFGDARSTN
jgi:hypothetical protein